ncbi:outer membrane protein OmpA-like peptidoglycan-associated protein [Haloferula luteola]|uniref:Outer membrane protein OmpA-like peptidoglycan-associated protein n=1 Tax=Haloferula luteola TaxID=595692 RepID=A0A840VFY1_9BACT|nr:OmpA family protein [Haloferula luteola]MBB5353508.1 outer membrane protein OmpA-like peptidoglycan-associated protein [Haloferula luteola]
MRHQVPYLLLAFGIGALAAFLLLNRFAKEPVVMPEVTEIPAAESLAPELPVEEEAGVPPLEAMEEKPVDSTAARLPENPGPGKAMRNPRQLVSEIGEALEAGDLDSAGQLIGGMALTPEAREKLAELAANGTLKSLLPDGAHEVGEMEVNARARWSLHLEGAEAGRERIFLDLVRGPDGWKVERLMFPPNPGIPLPKAGVLDPLGITDAFLQATLIQDFEKAREFVDSTSVSDAKIAGLCILFEEGDYRLRPEKPLRGMFEKEDTAGLLASVVSGEEQGIAQFSITLDRSAEHGWRIREINLDELLADYAARLGGGDVYYTPLLKNPKGGDTLVLYFDFDSDALTPRTERQLEIVADILRLDPDKKLTISGHTDALGSENYNEQLSGGRADAVKSFLVKSGVEEAQIETLARGPSQPLRPNFTESGADNPSGRRANRRSEIYLDF